MLGLPIVRQSVAVHTSSVYQDLLTVAGVAMVATKKVVSFMIEELKIGCSRIGGKLN